MRILTSYASYVLDIMNGTPAPQNARRVVIDTFFDDDDPDTHSDKGGHTEKS